jgi:hypothetical protein
VFHLIAPIGDESRAESQRSSRLAENRLPCDPDREVMRRKTGLIALCIVVAMLGFLAAALVAPVSAHRSTGTDPTEPTTAVTTTPPTTATETTSTQSTTTTTTTATTPGPGLPSIILPDPKITPGRLNPSVRQSTIKRTICKSGWTETIRPPVSYTNALKIQQMVLYEETGPPSEYEEDHFIPLELGGAPRNPENLWPEPHSQSKLSDPLETQLKRKVCRHLMTLKKARATIRLFKDTQG